MYNLCYTEYPNGIAVLNAFFGQGTGNIVLDNVRCAGDEVRLSDCSHNGFNINNCAHSQDAGVICPGI